MDERADSWYFYLSWSPTLDSLSLMQSHRGAQVQAHISWTPDFQTSQNFTVQKSQQN